MITFAQLKHLENEKFQIFHNEIEKYHKKVGYMYDWSRQWEYPWILKNTPLRKTDIVLDVGGGTCHLPSIVARRVKTVTVGDCYHERMFIPTEKNVEFLKMDISQYTSDIQYDIVLCVSVLEHIDDYFQAIKNITKLVKCGGYLVMTLDMFLDNFKNCKERDIKKVLNILKSDFELGEIDLSKEKLYQKETLQQMKLDLPNLYSKNYKNRTSLGIIVKKR